MEYPHRLHMIVHSSPEPRYKRPFDLTVLILSHILLAPLWLFLWIIIPIAIKLQDRGPVFYSQLRIGRDGYIFRVRKFRSMIVDAEAQTGAVWAGQDDPRITRVGRILRYTALDELPQVLNMWTGDMSIVGPRPERPELHIEFAATNPAFDQRLGVRPGLTGLAQVYGGYDTPPGRKLAYDLEYARARTLWLDIKLIILSVANTVLARWDRPEAVSATGPGGISEKTAVPGDAKKNCDDRSNAA